MILGTRLCEHRLLESEAKITFCCNRDKIPVRYFIEEDDIALCNNTQGFLLISGHLKYNLPEWRLFIDIDERSLKCVLMRAMVESFLLVLSIQ